MCTDDDMENAFIFNRIEKKSNNNTRTNEEVDALNVHVCALLRLISFEQLIFDI